MSYNLKDIILETWKLIQPKDNETEEEIPLLFDETKFNYLSSSDSDDDE